MIDISNLQPSVRQQHEWFIRVEDYFAFSHRATKPRAFEFFRKKKKVAYSTATLLL
jgi:hypothetical protein